MAALWWAAPSGRRRTRAFGTDGGEPGEPGRNLVRRVNGAVEELPACASAMVEAGDAVTIVTPTGGGWGDPAQRRS